jgi:hypothetical protein
MGIIVVDGALPSGIPISNVYMSFSGEIVYLSAINSSNLYPINTSYKVFLDPTKTLGSNIRIPIITSTSNISQGIYDVLYQELKSIYPNNVDCI